MKAAELVRKAVRSCRAGQLLDRETLVELLDIAPDSEGALLLRQAAHAEALRITGGRGYLWGALGLDNAPCRMSCRFCSLGEKWRLVRQPKVYDDAEVLRVFQHYAEAGVHYLVLRTTEFFSIEHLCRLLAAIRGLVPKSCELALNTGEFDLQTAERIAAAGGSCVYHTLRLREGTDTAFDPQTRLATMRAVQASPLRLAAMVEPIGPEHGNGEIAASFLGLVREGAEISGLMARVPVPGTPLGDTQMFAPERIAQITAALRLAGSGHTPDICVHPTTDLTLSSGANVAIIDMGAIPRDTVPADKAWRDYDCERAAEALQRAGWHQCQ